MYSNMSIQGDFKVLPLKVYSRSHHGKFLKNPPALPKEKTNDLPKLTPHSLREAAAGHTHAKLPYEVLRAKLKLQCGCLAGLSRLHLRISSPLNDPWTVSASALS